MELYLVNSKCFELEYNRKSKNAIYDVTFSPILSITVYSHISDLLILFDE